MVKWAEQISRTSSANSYLFKSSDYVRYAEIVAPLEANRDSLIMKSSESGQDSKSIFRTGLRLIDEEMDKIEKIVTETVHGLQQSIQGDALRCRLISFLGIFVTYIQFFQC